MDTTILLNGSTEIDLKSGITMSINWDALLPSIQSFVRLRPDEIINGLVINETDIRVVITRKKGRKNGSKNSNKISEPDNISDSSNSGD